MEEDGWQMQEWYMEQKWKEMGGKRRKYWGEMNECNSLAQIKRDNYLYRQFLNRQYLDRNRKDEILFRVEKEIPK